MKSNFISFIIGLIVFSIGCGYFAFEAMDFTVEEFPISEYISLKEYEKEYIVDGEKYRIIYDNINLVIDENEPNIKISTKYDSKILTLKQEEIETSNYISLRHSFKFNKYSNRNSGIIKLLKNSIKTKTLYDCEELFRPTITITVNSNNREYLIINHREY